MKNLGLQTGLDRREKYRKLCNLTKPQNENFPISQSYPHPKLLSLLQGIQIQ